MTNEQKLKMFLRSKGVTQTFVAKKVGMPVSSLCGVLNGEVSLKVDLLEDVCKVLGVPPADFFAFKCLDTRCDVS